MKFEKKFESHLTTEWRNQYMNYGVLKNMIKRAVEEEPAATPGNMHALKIYFQNFKDEFFRECSNELQKVDNFYQEKLAESRRKHANIKIQVMNSFNKSNTRNISKMSVRASVEKIKPMKTQNLRFSLSEFYLSLILLQNYQALNYTAFREICKKFDRVFHSGEGHNWFSTHVEPARFNQTSQLNRMITDIENLYTDYLANGDRRRALAKLHVPPLGETTEPSLVFRSGFWLGVFIVMFSIVCVAFYTHPPDHEHYTAFTNLYRGPFNWVIFNFFMAFNVAGFQHAGVNFILIFEIEPRDHLQPADYLEIASLIGILWSTFAVCFLFYRELNVDPFVFPLVLTFIMLTMVAIPIPIFHYRARLWFWKKLARIVAAPFCRVKFADFWIADQLNSLSVCMADYYFLVVFNFKYWLAREKFSMASRADFYVSFARSLPAWFRMAQCLRRYYDSREKYHIVNAVKYFTTFFVIAFATMWSTKIGSYSSAFDNPYLWCYIISCLVHHIFFYVWDVTRDFGLFQRHKTPKIFLRDTLLYPMFFYYFAIIENFFGRFFWAVEIYLLENKLLSEYIVWTISAYLEVFRRFIWNYLRLENEHLNNAGKFRATRDIFIAPLNTRDQKLLESMMDDDDGIDNRGKRGNNAIPYQSRIFDSPESLQTSRRWLLF